MAAPTTIAAPPSHEGLRIAREEDASPVVRLVARILGDTVRLGCAEGLGRTAGVVVVRSHDTPQAATVALGDGQVEVTGGAAGEPDATLVVDLNARFALTKEPTGDADLAACVLRALRPPVPHWSVAATRFWEATRDIPGIPDVLLVQAAGPDGVERDRFGQGTSTYGIAGPADLLAGVFSGADDFLAALAAGVQVQGTLSQLSVMTAASWKVRFDV